MNSLEMRNRTKKFSLDILELLEILPNSKTFKLIENQLGRAALSVGANYRATQRAKSKADFIYKLEIVIEEADETMYWLEVMSETGLIDTKNATVLIKEANELVSIFVATVKTTKANNPIKKT